MASSTDFIPSREADLVTFSANFSTKITADPTEYSLTVEQAAALAVLHTEFIEAYNTANDPLTRSPANITAKNLAKNALIENIRLLAGIVQKAPGTTDFERSELGLTVPDPDPSPIPAPTEMPVLEIVDRFGTTVRIKLHDGSGSRRGKPDGVDGATLFSFIGNTPPTDVAAWKFEGNTTKTMLNVEFASSLEPGTVVWFTAFWFNRRKESGPGCAPVSAIIAGGAMQEAA